MNNTTVHIYQPCMQCAAITDHGAICERCERTAQLAARNIALEGALRALIATVRSHFTGTHTTRPDVIAEMHKADQVLAGRAADTPKDDASGRA